MDAETCSQCGESVVEGRLNCVKCGAVYPDITGREMSWDPTEDESKGQ